MFILLRRFQDKLLYLFVFPIPGAFLLGVERQKKHEKIATLFIMPPSHLLILILNVAYYFSD